jgi:hypothetical protein
MMTPKILVTNVLTNGETAKMKPFSVGGNTIYPIYYQVLATRMSSFDSVTVHYHSKYHDRAKYFPGSNKMFIGFQSTVPPEGRSLIIHEATHAICDMLRLSMTRADSESLGYIAQCLHYKTNFGNNPLSIEGMEDVFAAASKIACAVHDGQTIPSADYDDLRNKLNENNTYKNCMNEISAYDGIWFIA